MAAIDKGDLEMATADSYENDNSWYSAKRLYLDSIQYRSLTAGDVDWVYFYVPEYGEYTFETTGNGDTKMYLYDSDMNLIASDDDGGESYNAEISRVLNPGEYYYVKVEAYNGREIPNYGLLVTQEDTPSASISPDLYENDNSRFKAKTISVGSTQERSLHSSTDEDWIKFTVAEDGFYSVVTSGGDTILQLYSFENQAFGYNDDRGNGNLGSFGVCQLYANTTYYARVTAYNGETCNYNISVTQGVVADTYESNNDNSRTSTRTTVSVGATQIHTIHSESDVDWMKVNITEDGLYFFSLGTSERDAGQMLLYLYDSNGVRLTNPNCQKESGEDPFIAGGLEEGTYYLKAAAANSGSIAGEYSVNVSKVSTLNVTDPDDYEDDGWYEDASTITVGNPQTHSLNVYWANGEYHGDVDYIKFTPTQTGTYKVSVFGTNAPSTMTVYAADEVGYPMAPIAGSSQINPFVENYMHAGQTYFIKMESDYTDLNIDTYTISVTMTSAYNGEQDTYESDNTVASAKTITVGSTQAHSIHNVSDVDWVKFTPTSSGYYTFYTGARNGNAGDADMLLGLYDASGKLLIYDDDSFTAYSAMLSYKMTAGQTYYLVAMAARNNAVVPYYTLSVASGILEDSYDIYMDERSRVDDTREDAKVILVGETQAHTIHDVGDVDWVGFIVDTTGNYILQTEGSGDTIISIYDEDGNFLILDDDSGVGRNASVKMRFVADRVYYAKVSSYQNALIPNYTLSLTEAGTSAGDAYESDNTISAAKGIIAGETQSHSIHVAGDVDWVKFRPIQSGTYQIQTSGDADMKLYLYSASGTLITSDDDSGVGVNARISINFNANTDYYIKASAYSSSALVDNYGLNISLMKSGLGDEYENDNSYSNAKPITLGVSQTHSIHENGDIDWVTFTPNVSAEYTFQTTGTGYNCDTQMYLFTSLTNAQRGVYAVFDDDSGADRNSAITAVLTAGQTYYVKVKAYSFYTIPSYGLRVTSAANGASADGAVNEDEYEATEQDISTRSKPMANSRVYSHSLHTNNDVDWQMFYTHYDGSYTFQTTGDYENYWMILYKRNPVTCVLEKVAEADGGGAGGNAAITMNLEKENWYYVRVASLTHEKVPLYGIRVDIDPQSVNGDAYESDNTQATAQWITANSTQNRSLHVPGDVDWVAFKTGSNSGSYILSSDCSTLAISVYKRNSDGSTTFVEKINSIGSDGTVYTLSASANTTYYFKIEGLRATYAVDSYKLVMSNPLDVYERDDLSSQAKTIRLGELQAHSFHTSTDVDWVKFTVSQSGNYIIDSDNTVSLHLHKQNGASVTPSGSAFSGDRSVSLTAGTYYLKMTSKNSTVLSTYSITVEKDNTVAADSYESDNTRGTAKTITVNGAAQTHSLHTAADVDYVKFTASANYKFNCTTTGGANLALTLYDSVGNSLATNRGVGASIERTITSAGTYYLKIESAASEVVESYSVRVQSQAVNIAENYVVLFNGGYEPAQNYVRYYDTLKAIYNKLVNNFGIDPTHIYILNADGRSDTANQNLGSYNSPSLDKSDWRFATSQGSKLMSGTMSSLTTAVNEIARSFDNNDHFLLYTSDHGASNGNLCTWYSEATGSQVNGALSALAGKGYQTFLFAQCYSGDILDDISMTGNRWGMASASESEPSRSSSYSGFGFDVLGAFDRYGIGLTTTQLGQYVDAQYLSCPNSHPDNGICNSCASKGNYSVQHTWDIGSNFQVFAQS